MSGRFGFQSFVEKSQFSGAELPPAFSEETSRAIDAEVSRIVSDAYAKAKKLLEENRTKVETLATKLLEAETLDGDAIKEILA